MSEPPATEQPVETVAKTTVQAKRSGRSVAIRLVIGLTLAGVFGGCLLGLFVNSLPKGPWSQLDLGQDRAIRIIGSDDLYHRDSGNMYISMASGEVYRCWMNGGYEPEKRCNKVTTEQVSNKRYECNYSQPLATPQTPGELVDSLCYPIGFGERIIAILTDGSVWEWKHDRGELDMSGLSAAMDGSLAGFNCGSHSRHFCGRLLDDPQETFRQAQDST